MTDTPPTAPTTEPDPPPGGARPFRASHRTAWQVLNTTTVPVWLAMIVAPRSRATAALVRRFDLVLAGLGITYVGLLVAGLARAEGGPPDLSDPASVAAGLGVPEAFLAGWTHYLAFDLLAGRSVWEESLAAGRTARLPLLLTWWAGPAGVTLHLARRRRWRSHPA